MTKIDGLRVGGIEGFCDPRRDSNGVPLVGNEAVRSGHLNRRRLFVSSLGIEPLIIQ
jgi:hypothetical protein